MLFNVLITLSLFCNIANVAFIIYRNKHEKTESVHVPTDKYPNIY